MSHHPLTTDLEANRYTVDKLIEMARRGALRVPPFQRPLRWRREDHRLLLDSLYRGYPVGTLLLWKRPAPQAALVFGGFHVDAPETPNAYWIVDGQQRITSLVGCFLHEGDLTRRRPTDFAFYFDLEKDMFVPASGQSASHLIPVNCLADPVQLSMWATEMGIGVDLHRRAQEVGAKLRKYEIPAYVTQAEDDQVLRIVFERANTAGKRMRSEEIFEALNKGLSPSDSPAGLIERLRAVLQALDFGTVRGRTLQKALVGVAGHNPKDDIPPMLREPGAAVQWERKTADALRLTVEFLRDACDIPHALTLPYDLPLIVLPRFFERFPAPRERSVELLVRWVWRGIATQTHMVTNQFLSPYYQALRKESEEEVVQRMLRLVGSVPPATLPRSRVFTLHGMATKLELAVLFRLNPVRLPCGDRLSPVEVFEKTTLARQPTLPGLVPTSGSTAPERASRSLDLPTLPVTNELKERLAARFLHPAVKGGSGAFIHLLQMASDDALASHAVPPEQWANVRSGRWEEVVTGRTVHLKNLVSTTIARFARWFDDDDGPSIDALISSDVEGGYL